MLREGRGLVVVLVVAGCGARTELAGSNVDASVDATASDASEERDCEIECFIGHECCIGGCDGPPASMPNDCCACLPGESNSMTCNGSSKCGK